MRHTTDEMSVDAPGGRTRVLLVNTKNPLGRCFLVHGLFDSAEGLLPLMDLLAGAGYACAALDLPGFGRADAGREAPCGQAAYARYALDVAGRVFPGEALCLIGHSMGGGVALRMAAMQPRSLACLTLLAPAVRFGRGARLMGRTAAPFLPAYLRGRRAVHGVMIRALGELPGEDRQESLLAPLRRAETAAFLGRLMAERYEPMRPFTEKPVLLLWGGQDRVLGRWPHGFTAALVPGARMRVLPGAPHCFPETRPQETCALLLPFLEEAIGG